MNLVDLIRQEISRALSRRPGFHLGVVTRVDWKNQLATVRLASGYETPWLRIATTSSLELHPLDRGEEVAVEFANADPSGLGVIKYRLYGQNAPPDFPEGSFGKRQGQAKCLFNPDGSIAWSGLSTVSISSTQSISADAPSIKLGSGAVSAAVKYDELARALSSTNPTSWVFAVTAALQALGVTLPPMDISPARSAKVKLL